METKRVNNEMRALLRAPLPPEAVTPHPTKKYLSSIKSIYVTERLNEVFGIGAWSIEADLVDRDAKMVVVKTKFRIPEYNIYYECYGGNDNADLGDAYKGATTDALTKIASWLGIGSEVFKGEASKASPKPSQSLQQKKTLTIDLIMEEKFLTNLCSWLKRNSEGRKIEDVLRHYYNVDEEVVRCVTNEYLRVYGS
ncbi:MAG: hypothetical protein IKY51_03135 [Alistipes sp.]|nr:hypothetical protein [Alistipes sp.]